jgi:hypothetical protein
MQMEEKFNIKLKGKSLTIHHSNNGTITESDYESVWGDSELILDGSQVWDFNNCKQNKHKKVYANQVLLSNPPQCPWVCEICGFRSVDRSELNTTTYEELMMKFYSNKHITNE